MIPSNTIRKHFIPKDQMVPEGKLLQKLFLAVLGGRQFIKSFKTLDDYYGDSTVCLIPV